MMEWSNETVLSFIDDYRSNPSLWDTKVPDYKNMVLKKSVLRSLAKKYDCDIGHIKRKIKSLRTAFRREVTKVRNRRSIEGAGSDSTSKWFAYRPLNFLLEDESLKLEVDAEVEDEVDVEDPSEIHDYDKNYITVDGQPETGQIFANNFIESAASLNNIPESVHYCNGSVSPKNVIPQSSENTVNSQLLKRPKLKRPAQSNVRTLTMDQSVMEACKLFRPQINSQVKDEFDYFGRNIAARIRKLKTDKARSCVQHLVSNIIFEAEMGKYDNGLSGSSGLNNTSNAGENRLNDSFGRFESQGLDANKEPFIKLEM